MAIRPDPPVASGTGEAPRGRLREAAVIAVAVGLGMAGCAVLQGPTPLGRAADEAATWPIVTDIYYRASDWFDDEGLDLTVRNDAPADEVRRLWCDLLMPAGAGSSNTLLMDDHGWVLVPPACPGPSPRAADA